MVTDDEYDGPYGAITQDGYLAWVLGGGRNAARAFLPDARSATIRTPVLIAFRNTTLERIRAGDDFEANGEAWSAGIRIPEYIFTFNDLSKRLAEVPLDGPGMVEHLGIVMAFASDNALEAYRTEGESLKSIIYMVSPGPAFETGQEAQPIEDTAPDFSDPWPGLHKDIGGDLSAFFVNLENEGRDPEKLGFLNHKNAGPVEEDLVITAVIDDGIAYVNDRFRVFNGKDAKKPFKTAIQAIWIQQAASGVDFSRGEINDQMKASSSGGQLDEENVYRRAGLLDYGRPDRHVLGYPATHGTGVLDAAIGIGWPPTSEAELNRKLLMAVQVPANVVGDTSLSRLHPFIFAALIYLLLRSAVVTLKLRYSDYPGAKEKDGASPVEATLRPMIVNLSFGNTAGPHDGKSVFEYALDRMIAWWSANAAPLSVVLPSGNSHLARGHARTTLCGPADSDTARLVLPWRVQPDDKTESAVEIWLPPSDGAPTARVRAKVLPPGLSADGTGTGFLDEGDPGPLFIGTVEDGELKEAVCLLTYRFNPLDRRGVFLVNLAPTASFRRAASGRPTVLLAPSGVWQIVVEKIVDDPDEIGIAAWVERDDTPYNYRRFGRQSRFEDPTARRHDHAGRPIETDDGVSLVKSSGNMSAIATGCRPVVVGGVIQAAYPGPETMLKPARYSAGGPTDTPPCDGEPARTGPDVVAVSDISAVRHGVLVTGTLGGSAARLSGTSIAAPQVTYTLARLAETGKAPDRATIQASAESGGVNGPVERTGAGLVSYPLNQR